MNVTISQQRSDYLQKIADLQGHGEREGALHFLIDQAAEVLSLDQLVKAADDAVRTDGLVPDRPISYPEWLHWTGKDDSFTGNGTDIPGTADLYDAAIDAFERMAAGQPKPEALSIIERDIAFYAGQLGEEAARLRRCLPKDEPFCTARLDACRAVAAALKGYAAILSVERRRSTEPST